MAVRPPPVEPAPGSPARLRQLRVFVAVADAGGIGAAAEVLGTTQPPLTRMLLRLEQGVGVALFDRHRRGVRLTAAGEALLPAARDVLRATEAFESAAAAVATGQAGVLRVGTTEGATPLTSTALRLFGTARPHVQVQLHPAHTPAKLAMVRAGELDVAFVRNAAPVRGLEIVDVWRESLVAVVAATHPLAGTGPTPLAALAAYPLLVTPREINPAVHDAVLALFDRAGIGPRLGPPMLSEGDALSQIAASRQWTLLGPTAAAGPLPLTTLEIDPPAEVQVGLAWRAHDTRPPVRSFVAAAHAAARHLRSSR